MITLTILLLPLIFVLGLGLMAKVFTFLFKRPGDDVRYARLADSLKIKTSKRLTDLLNPESEEYLSRYLPK